MNFDLIDTNLFFIIPVVIRMDHWHLKITGRVRAIMISMILL